MLSNQPGAGAVTSIEYLYELGTDYDHLPIGINLDIEAFHQAKRVLPKHYPINYSNIKAHEWNGEQRSNTWALVWAPRKHRFEEQIKNDDVQGAHDTWCEALEHFLKSQDRGGA